MCFHAKERLAHRGPIPAVTPAAAAAAADERHVFPHFRLITDLPHLQTMDELKCRRCNTTNYRNPSMKLMVNSCGHGICDNCVESLFARGSGNCPVCQISLRKGGYRLQVFSDSSVEKEVDIRKQILNTFNKKEEDFEDLREYNDYLERVETIIFNLANDVDVEETKRQVESYRKENEKSIIRNRSRKSKDEELIDQLIDEEKEVQAFRKEFGYRQDAQDQMIRERNKQKDRLIDELMHSDASASQILQQHSVMADMELKKQQKIASDREDQQILTVREIMRRKGEKGKFSTGISYGSGLRAGDHADPDMTAEDEDEPFVFVEDIIELNGPPVPAPSELQETGHLKHVRSASPAERAGGFHSTFPCYRALQEAFCSLFFSPADPDADQE